MGCETGQHVWFGVVCDVGLGSCVTWGLGSCYVWIVCAYRGMGCVIMGPGFAFRVVEGGVPWD